MDRKATRTAAKIAAEITLLSPFSYSHSMINWSINELNLLYNFYQ